MKKIVLFISALLFLSVNAYGQVSLKSGELTKVQGKQLFKTVLGENSDEVIIGNETDKGQAFSPDITFTKWQGECSLKIIPDKSWFSGTPTLSADSKQLEIGGDKIGFYYKPGDDLFKFGLILNDIPDKSFLVTIDGVEYYQWQFKLEGWEDYDFFYQPPLTEEWKIGDSYYGHTITKVSETEVWCNDIRAEYRPENCIGSYAIYHKEKKNHILGKTNYGTGKLFHDYRIRFIDSNGNIQYAILNYTDGIRSVFILKKWIDDAKYPIKANDTVGYTGYGSSGTGWSDTTNYIEITSPADASGNFSGLSCYVQRGGSDGKISLALFNDDGGSAGWMDNNTRRDYGIEISSTPVSAGWVESTELSTVIAPSTSYWIGKAQEQQHTWYKDTGSITGNWLSHAYEYPLNSHTAGFGSDATKWAIYATYTPSGGGEEEAPLRRKKVIFITDDD